MPSGNRYISVIAPSLVGVLVRLVEELESRPTPRLSEVQTTSRENGPSLSILVLAAAILESTTNRLRYFETIDQEPPTGDRKRQRPAEKMLAWLRRKLPEDVCARCEELMAARDMVMHAHIWVARTADGRFVERPVLRPGYGDPKFDRVLDPDTRKSRLLSLNLFPTRVWRRDAYLAIKSMVATLRALESIEGLDPTGFRIEGNTESYDFKGGFLTLPQIADALVIPNDGG